MAQPLGLANRTEWNVWCKEGLRPTNVPAHPDRTYKGGGWQGWGHWLGTGNSKNHRATVHAFLPFGDALVVARSLGLTSKREWKVWCKEGTRPPNVPAGPDNTYKDGGWQGWGHWLGTGPAESGTAAGGFGPKVFLPFGAALAIVRSFGLSNRDEWRAWCKTSLRPSNVPTMPDRVYRDGGWRSLAHWLGTAA